MHLLEGNKTLQILENHQLTAGKHMFWNIATVISATISIRNAFDSTPIPDTCLVFNHDRLEVENKCKFSVSMTPNEEEIRGYGNKVSFICCTEVGISPAMWSYSRCSKLTPLMVGKNLTVDDEVCGHGCEEDVSIMFVCGKEEDGDTKLFGISKLILNTGHKRVLLFTEFYPVGGDSDVPNCANAYTLSITPHRLAPEHVMNVTRGSTSVPETVALSTPGSDTTEHPTPIATASTGHTSGTTPIRYTLENNS